MVYSPGFVTQHELGLSSREVHPGEHRELMNGQKQNGAFGSATPVYGQTSKERLELDDYLACQRRVSWN